MPKKTSPLSRYLAELGKKGGSVSRRDITPEQQAKMQRARRKSKSARKAKR